MPLAAPEHKGIPVHGGAAGGRSQQAVFTLIRPPRPGNGISAIGEMLCASPLLQQHPLQSPVLQRLTCVYMWALGCLLVLTLCAIDF